MGCVTWECQQNFATQPRHWSATSVEVWRSEESENSQRKHTVYRMVTDNRLISVPRLRVEMIRRFRRRLSVRSIVNMLLVASYRSRCPARCPRLTLGLMRRWRMWGRMHWWDLRHWRHCVLGDESRFTLFHSDGRARVRRRQREGLIDSRI